MGTSLESALIGRTRELALLCDTLTAARTGSVLAVVTGEAGVGKSRLVTEALATPQMQGAWIIRGECIASSRDAIPLAPVLEGLRTLAARVTDGPSRRRLEALVRGGPDTVTTPRSLVAAVLDAIVAAAEGRRVLLVVDDLQWADGATIGLVEHVARNVPGTRVTGIATLRSGPDVPQAVDRLTAELARRRQVRFIDVQPLDAEAVREMVEAAWGPDVSDDVVQRILELSGGIPFHLESIFFHGDRTARTLPKDLRLITANDVNSLTKDAGHVLDVLATITEPAERALLAAAAGVHGERLERALDDLEAAHLAVRTEGRWMVRHALITEVVAAGHSRAHRRRIHAALAGPLRAEAGASADAASAAELFALGALHAAAADDDGAALRDHLAAANAGLASGQAELAARQARQALRLARRHPDTLAGSGWRLDAIERMAARALSAAGEAGEALRLLGSAADDTDRDADSLARSLLLRNVILGQVGDVDTAARLTAEMLDSNVAEGLSSVARCRLLNVLASCRGLQGRGSESLQLARQALAIARRERSDDDLAEARSNVAMGLLLLGDHQAAAAEARRAWRLIRAGGAIVDELAARPDDCSRIYAIVNIADLHVDAGAYASALEIADTVMARLQCARSMSRECRLMASAAVDALTRTGRWAEAVLLIRAALRGAEPNLEALFHAYHARVLAASGRFRQSRAELERARHRLGLGNDPWVMLEVAACAAEAWMWEGDIARVRSAARSGILAPGEAWTLYAVGLELHALRLAAESGAEPGRRRRATAHAASRLTRAIEAAEAAVERCAQPHMRGLRPTLIDWCRAEVARLEGHDDAAAWVELAEGWRRIGRPLDEAYALFRSAGALPPGDEGDAADALLRAHRLCHRLSARPLAWRIEREGARLGLELSGRRRLDGPDPAAVEQVLLGLTDRERQVAELIAKGASNRDIARELVITEKTASIHVSNIIGKLGVQRRGEVAALMHHTDGVSLG